MIIIYVLAALLLGACIGWFIGRSFLQTEYGKERAQLQSSRDVLHSGSLTFTF